MKITIEVSDKNEGTRAPWWLIIDPHQNFRTDTEACHNIASMLTGPYFSREEAEAVLKAIPHRFKRGAAVYCCSGHMSGQYAAGYKEAERIES